MKNLVKDRDKESVSLIYIRKIFFKIFDTKLKENIFVGPQIHKLREDPQFDAFHKKDEMRQGCTFSRTFVKVS